jgi:N-acyl homoserine lactone hydrolase
VLWCLQTGAVRVKRGERGVRRYVRNDWSEGTLPVNCFLVERPDGLVLFDTGQTAAAAAPGYLPRWHPFLRLARFELRPNDEAAAQIRALGHAVDDVRTVVLSHLHTDHVGGLEPFAGSDVVVTRREWERASGIAGKLRGYVPQHWPPGLVPRLVDFHGPAVGPFPCSYDLAGDGELLLLPTSGHTPGHTALLVREQGRQLLLAGDLVQTAGDLDHVAPEIGAWVRSERVVVLTSHDPHSANLIASRPVPDVLRQPHLEKDRL